MREWVNRYFFSDRPDSGDQPRAALVGAVVFVVGVYFLNFVCFAHRIGPFDYNHLSAYYELAWRFWLTSGSKLAEYNPYLCGGRTLGGDPQIPVYHPLTLLVPALGATRLIKFEMLGQLALGLYGLVKWMRYLGVRPLGAWWGSFLFLSGGGVVSRFMVGHVTLGFYFLLPLFFYLSYRLAEDIPAPERRRLRAVYYLLGAYAGLYKPNFLIYFVPPLLFEITVRAYLTRRLRPVAEFVAALGIATLVGAVSWLAAWKYFSDFPRTDGSQAQWVAPYALLANILLPLKAIPKAFYGPGFLQRHEYNIFLGPVALISAYWGLGDFSSRARGGLASAGRLPMRPEIISLLAFAVASALLGLGRSESAWGILLPGEWLNDVWPGFQSVRVPTRFWFGIYAVLILFSARGFRWPSSRRAAACWLVLGVLPLILNAGINLSKTTWRTEVTQNGEPRLFPPSIEQVHEHPDLPYRHIRRGEGVIDCTENLEVYRATSLREGDLLQATTSAPARVETRWLDWNRIQIKALSAHPFSLSFNLNQSALWRFRGTGAALVEKLRAPLTLTSPTGEIDGELIFDQPLVAAGLWLSGLAAGGLLIFSAWAFWPRPRSFRRVGLTGGVAAGKSLAAQTLREHGITVLDLDAIGREILAADPDLIPAIVGLLGDVTASGQGLNRQKIREIVFADRKKLRALEQILHPRIEREFEARCEVARSRGEKIVVCEAALLIEHGYHRKLDFLIVITAPESIRIARLQARDAIDEILAQKMLAAQTDDTAREQIADVCLVNAATPGELRRQVIDLVERWKKDRWL